MKIMLISDTHLGNGSHADDFAFKKYKRLNSDQKFLADIIEESVDCTTLILNGDIYELWQFTVDEIKKEYPALTSYFEDPDNNIIFLKGNHDIDINKPIKAEMSVGNFDVHIEHGHKNHKEMTSLTSIILTWLYGWIERFIPTLDSMLTGKSDEDLYKHVDNLVIDYFADIYKDRSLIQEKVEGEESIDIYGKIPVLALGHTHAAGIWKIKDCRGRVLGIYVNSGSCDHGKFDRIIIDERYIECRTKKEFSKIKLF